MKKREYILILLPIFALVALLLATPTTAVGGANIKIVGQEALWGGPNTYIASTYHFGSGPIFVKSGTIVMLTDTTVDPHTLTLAVASDLPNSATAALNCGESPTDICSTAGAVAQSATSNCVSLETPSNTGLTPSSPCQLTTPYNAPSPSGDQVIITPGETLYLQITGSPGTVIHFMCIIHPWMQGEFVITK